MISLSARHGALIEVPLPTVKIIEDRLKGFVGNLDGLAVAVWFLEFVNVEQTAVEIRNPTEQSIELRSAFPAARPSRKRRSRKYRVK